MDVRIIGDGARPSQNIGLKPAMTDLFGHLGAAETRYEHNVTYHHLLSCLLTHSAVTEQNYLSGFYRLLREISLAL